MTDKSDTKLSWMETAFAAAGTQDEDLNREQLEQRYIVTEGSMEARFALWGFALLFILVAFGAHAPWNAALLGLSGFTVVIIRVWRARLLKRIKKMSNQQMIDHMDRLRLIRRDDLP